MAAFPRNLESDLGAYLEHLRGLPFVRGVIQNVTPRRNRHDFRLTIRTPKGPYRMSADDLGSHLDRATLNAVLARPRRASAPLLLLAPYVSREMADRLVEADIAFVDRVGNCYLKLGTNYVAHSVGHRPRPEPERAVFRAPAYNVFFTLLADPSLAAAPMRHIASVAGVSLGTVAAVISRLRAERFIVGSRSKSQLVGASSLLDRWVSAYADLLRPRLLIGRYDPGSTDSETLEARIEESLTDSIPWAYGGTAAGHRLTRFYRGEETVVHLPTKAADLVMRRLRARPKRDGTLHLVQCPAPLALKGPLPHVAHPLLIYAEMLCETSPRAAEAAREIRDRFLKLP